jgi:hypothetical protein
MIVDFSNAVIFFVFGAAVGGLYFWLLWLAVRNMTTSPNPWKSGVIGVVARLGLLILSFAALVIFKADAIGIIFWLIGFLALKFFIVGRIKTPVKTAMRSGV